MAKEKITPGIYPLVVMKASRKNAKASGDAYLSLECKVEGQNAKVWEIIMLEGKGMTLGKLKIAGWGFDPNHQPNPDEFLDRRAEAHLDYEDWNGESWLKVKAFATKTGGYVMPAALAGDEPPRQPHHGNPQKPSGRPRTRPEIVDAPKVEDEDDVPF